MKLVKIFLRRRRRHVWGWLAVFMLMLLIGLCGGVERDIIGVVPGFGLMLFSMAAMVYCMDRAGVMEW